MRLFSLFGAGQRTPDWSFSARGAIWRILCSENSRIIGECRHQEQKLVSFFCLNAETGAVRWEDLRLSEHWWVGIEAVLGRTLLLHEFAKPDMPEHKCIIAYDIESGQQRWRNDELTYWFGQNERVYAYRDTFDKRIGYAVNVMTGEIEHTYESLDELHALRGQRRDEQSSQGFRFPEPAALGSIQEPLRGVVTRETRGKPVAGDIEYVVERGFLIFNYHTPVSGSLIDAPLYDNRFAIVDLSRGRRVFSDVIVRQAKAPAPDSFFLKLPFVYFIKESNTLSALRLWTS